MYKVLAHSTVEERDIVVFESPKPSLDLYIKYCSIIQKGDPLEKGDIAVIRSELLSILSGYLKHQVWGKMKPILDESGVPLSRTYF